MTASFYDAISRVHSVMWHCGGTNTALWLDAVALTCTIQETHPSDLLSLLPSPDPSGSALNRPKLKVFHYLG